MEILPLEEKALLAPTAIFCEAGDTLVESNQAGPVTGESGGVTRSLKPRVLHVIPTLGPQYGGPSVACIELCKALVRAGVDVTIATTTIDLPTKFISSSEGAQWLDGVEIRFFKVTGARAYWFSFDLARYLRESVRKFDVVHIHSLYRFHLAVTAHYCRKFNVPYVVRPHGSLDPFLYKRKRWRKWPHEMIVERPAFRHAVAIHFTAREEATLAETAGLFRNGIEYRRLIVPNGVSFPEWRLSGGDNERRLREKYPELENKKIVLFLGRIDFKKGLDLLIDAFSGVIKRHSDAHLLIVGPDSNGYKKVVVDHLRNRNLMGKTTFTGLLMDEDKAAAFRIARVFVLPSYTENFGIAIVEAMSYGVPVVISNKVNIWREIKAAGAGTIVNTDAGEVEEAICRILEDVNLAKRIGERGIECSLKEFSWERAARTLKEFYSEFAKA